MFFHKKLMVTDMAKWLSSAPSSFHDFSLSFIMMVFLFVGGATYLVISNSFIASGNFDRSVEIVLTVAPFLFFFYWMVVFLVVPDGGIFLFDVPSFSVNACEDDYDDEIFPALSLALDSKSGVVNHHGGLYRAPKVEVFSMMVNHPLVTSGDTMPIMKNVTGNHNYNLLYSCGGGVGGEVGVEKNLEKVLSQFLLEDLSGSWYQGVQAVQDTSLWKFVFEGGPATVLCEDPVLRFNINDMYKNVSSDSLQRVSSFYLSGVPCQPWDIYGFVPGLCTAEEAPYIVNVMKEYLKLGNSHFRVYRSCNLPFGFWGK